MVLPVDPVQLIQGAAAAALNASNTAQALAPSAATDVVAVFDGAFNQVFADARPLKLKVSESSKAMEHPVETGATITDFVIDLPVEIELSLILASADYRGVMQQIRQLKALRQLLTVQTKAGTYFNMLITDVPHDEDAELFDALAVSVKLKEVRLVEAQYARLPAKKVAKKSATSTVNRGQQQTTAAPEQKKSLLYRLFN